MSTPAPCPCCGSVDLTPHDSDPDSYDDDVSYTSHSCDHCGLWHDGWRDVWLLDCARWQDENDAKAYEPPTL